MSLVDGKRITFKRARPNPLFQDWVEELHKEAQQKRSKFEGMLKEALTSISKYPLPLQSGAECAILKGFDKRLCLILDRRLKTYKGSNARSLSQPSIESDKNVTFPITISSTTSPKLQERIQNTDEILSNNDYHKSSKNSIKYKPAFRSGGYAILMALLDQRTHNNQEMFVKSEIIDAAQKYCEESFIRPKPDTYYTSWSNMTRLIKKGLVKKTGGRKPQYSLTDLGITVAKELLIDSKIVPSVNDIIFNDEQYDKITSESIETDKVILQDSPLNDYSPEIIPQNGETFSNKEISPSLDKQLIVMDADSYDVILLIDKNETGGVSKKNDPTVAQFNKFPDLKHEYRSLKVGDFTWIARHRVTNQELVLPYVVERKRMDDLGASIKDGRFHEQKFRLKKCGLKNVIYMVENYGGNKHVGLPVPTLMQALANTRIQDDYKVHMTDCLSHSARFLAMMTLRLTIEFKGKTLKGHNKESTDDILMAFEFFNKSSLKNKTLTVTDTFIKLLLQLKGVSVEKALAITNVYRTPRSLIEAYELCSQKDGEMLLSNLRCGEMSRSVGPGVSKTVYQLFTFRNIF